MLNLLMALATAGLSSLNRPDSLVVDLASTPPGDTVRVAIQPGEYRIVVSHLLPEKHYAVSTDIEAFPILPLALPSHTQAVRNATDSVRMTSAQQDAICSRVGSETTLLREAKDERQVGPRLALLLSSLATVIEYQDRCLETVVNAFSVAEATRQSSETAVSLHRGQALTVTIRRVEDHQTWVIVYSAGARGSWHTTYGFSFVYNHDQRFFARDTAITSGSGETATTANQFVVRRQGSSRLPLDFVPTVLFQWQSSSDETKSWENGPTAGFGFDLKTPVVLAGWQFTYNQNIGISGGVSFAQRRRLRGEYSEGQILKQTLSSDQLTESIYMPSFYISINLRSLTNPFEARADNQSH